ncbi:halo transducer protein [Halorussus marinus]|uniref:halo transducer protein n=1 Tax=Halorussus marinus TaxID=2505976 RepID=UPI00106EC987|nr:halo transducer protein [Halorussus marinus]
MHTDDGRGTGESIEGRSVDDAVTAIVRREDGRDPEAVRAALERVATDGVVTREGVEAALAHASKVVSTPETRVEMAAIALGDARDAAEPVTDLDSVGTRLDAFEARLASVEDRTAELGDRLDTLVGPDGADAGLYETAAEIRRLTGDATRAQRAADQLKLDLESFQRWLSTPSVRVRELETDVETIEATLDDLSAAVDDVGSAPAEARADSTPDGAVWADATLRTRVAELLLADVRAELADLRAWADREAGDDAPGPAPETDLDDLGDRLDRTDGRLTDLRGRLDGLARESWSDRFGDRLDAFEDATEGLEPPLDWAGVEAAFDEHRPAVERTA